jgi:hypothetical protein
MLSEIWECNLIQSIRSNHANLTEIAEYEENESSNEYSKVDTQKEMFNL